MAATMTVGRKLLANELRNCTLIELVRRLHMKDPGCCVSKSTLCEIRCGNRVPTLRLANAFAVAFGIPCYAWFQAA